MLFHGGYPWYHEIGALAHNHGNVYVDMVWLPLISTTAAVSALHEYIEVVPSIDRIAWGSDSWTSEEAFGALMAFQHVVSPVLAEKVRSSYFGKDEAMEIAEKLMFRNAQKIYNICDIAGANNWHYFFGKRINKNTFDTIFPYDIMATFM